jgi:hypothetical protein
MLFRPREIRKVLPLTRLKRLEETSVGRVSRDSLPVIRLRKSEGPEVGRQHEQVTNSTRFPCSLRMR